MNHNTNNQNPFFSIITVSLNAGIYLNKTIESILIQSFTDFEIIVKDGGSIDNSLDLLPKDPRIVKINKNDNGIYDAMNQSLEYSHGKYILFLNAADYFYDNTILDTYYSKIIENTFPDIIYGNYMSTRRYNIVQSPIKLTNFTLFRNTICHQACMIKNECYIEFGNFDLSYKVFADYDLLLRLIIDKKIRYKYINKIISITTYGGYSIKNKDLGQLEVKKIREKHFKLYGLYNLLYMLSLPKLRRQISLSDSLASKIYSSISNYINKRF